MALRRPRNTLSPGGYGSVILLKLTLLPVVNFTSEQGTLFLFFSCAKLFEHILKIALVYFLPLAPLFFISQTPFDFISLSPSIIAYLLSHKV